MPSLGQNLTNSKSQKPTRHRVGPLQPSGSTSTTPMLAVLKPSLGIQLSHSQPSSTSISTEREVASPVNLNRLAPMPRDRADHRKPPRQSARKSIPLELRVQILVRDEYCCCICGASRHLDRRVQLEVDHILPVSRGGTNRPDNLQTLCWKCNRGKSNRVL